MKTTKTLCLGLVALMLGCGSDAAPRRFLRKQALLGCRTTKKCNKLAWNELDHRNARECAREELDDFEDDFVDQCEDYDPQAARECLQGMRAVRRTCDAEAASDSQVDACAEVCGKVRPLQWTGPMLGPDAVRVATSPRIIAWMVNRAGLSEPGLSEPGMSEPRLSDPGLLEPGPSAPELLVLEPSTL